MRETDALSQHAALAKVPSFFEPPEQGATFDGATLASGPIERLTATPGCTTYDCRSGASAYVPFTAWTAINERALARLRGVKGVAYALAVVPGYAGPRKTSAVLTLRLQGALRLLQQGWVGALLLSGGYQRGGFCEARYMYEQAQQLAVQLGIDVTDKIFIEPCACHSSSNVRNSLQIMEAMGVTESLLVTEGDSYPWQASYFYWKDIADQLGCLVGRIVPLRGRISMGAVASDFLRDTARGGASRRAGTGDVAIFWIAPGSILPDGRRVTARECGPGVRKLARCEGTHEPDEVGAPKRPQCKHPQVSDVKLLSIEQELGQFDPSYDCPSMARAQTASGSEPPEVAPRLDRRRASSDDLDTLQDLRGICAQNGPHPERFKYFLVKPPGSFGAVTLGGGIRFEAGVHPTAELKYTLALKLADLTHWRHEIGLIGSFGLESSTYTLQQTDQAAAARLRLAPQWELGVWYRPRMGDAPVPLIQLSGGLTLPHHFDLPERAESGPIWFGDLGVGYLFGLRRLKIMLDLRMSSSDAIDFGSAARNQPLGFSVLGQLGYWFPTKRRHASSR